MVNNYLGLPAPEHAVSALQDTPATTQESTNQPLLFLIRGYVHTPEVMPYGVATTPSPLGTSTTVYCSKHFSYQVAKHRTCLHVVFFIRSSWRLEDASYSPFKCQILTQCSECRKSSVNVLLWVMTNTLELIGRGPEDYSLLRILVNVNSSQNELDLQYFIKLTKCWHSHLNCILLPTDIVSNYMYQTHIMATEAIIER